MFTLKDYKNAENSTQVVYDFIYNRLKGGFTCTLAYITIMQFYSRAVWICQKLFSWHSKKTWKMMKNNAICTKSLFDIGSDNSCNK